MTEFGLDPAAQIRALKRQLGVSDEQARAIVAGATVASADRLPPVTADPVIFPVQLMVPWSALVSDDRKYAPALRGQQPVLLLTDRYRQAKARTLAVARDAVQGNPAAIPLQLHAQVWVPDNRPGHDVANFAKCCHDALEGVVYTKDEWLHDVRWTRAGVDVDRPRAEIRIVPWLGVGA